MVRVKICGITNLEDARVAAEAGADMLGFVFYPRSPRYIPPERARDIMAALRARGDAPKFVGVFVNESLESVRSVIATVPLDLVQLHGDEPVEAVRALSPLAFKALRPSTMLDAHAAVSKYRAAVNGNTPAFLIDAYDADKFGGTGVRGDWAIAAQIAREYPILMAGGLRPENVREAVETVLPWGVDVSSGVEHTPGVKDHTKVREFIRKAKSSLRER